MPVVTVYTARLTARCWKQNTCASCACVYRYKVERSASQTANTAERAQDLAVAKVDKELKDAVENHPCPACGLVQPDFIAGVKKAIHGTTALLAFFALVIIIVPAFSNGLTLDFAGLLGAGVLGVAGLFHFFAMLYNPNYSRQANREKGQSEVASGVVEVVSPGAADRLDKGPANVTMVQFLLLLFVLGGGAAMLIPWHIQNTQPTPQNGERFVMPDTPVRPILIAPGETVTLNFPTKDAVESVGGRWQATPTVEVLNQREVGAKTLPVTTENGSWGTQLKVEKNQAKSTANLYARVTLPDNGELSGKEVVVRATLAVTYPAAFGDTAFTNKTKTVTETFTIKVAAAEQIAFYREAFQFGALAAFVGLVIGGLGLTLAASALRRRGRPTQLVFIEAGSPGSMQAVAAAENRRRWMARGRQ